MAAEICEVPRMQVHVIHVKVYIQSSPPLAAVPVTYGIPPPSLLGLQPTVTVLLVRGSATRVVVFEPGEQHSS